MRTLIVEDEMVSRKKLERIMLELGACASVDDAGVAIREFKQALKRGEPYDLVTLDLEMHEMHGNEVLYEIRGYEKANNVPPSDAVKIMVVTSHQEPQTVRTCTEAGCDAYLVKPFDRDSIMQALSFMGIAPPNSKA